MIQTYKATIKHEVEHGYLLQEEDVVLYADHEAEIAFLTKYYSDKHTDYLTECKALHERIKELEAYIADMDNAYEMTMDERCTVDEKHCTCVPFLKQRIKELEVVLRKIAVWEFNIMGDCVADAQKLAKAALKEKKS